MARRFGLDPGGLFCGSGSDELLGLLARGYAGPGDEVIHTEHGFLMYPIVTRSVGAMPVVVKERNLTADVDAILDAVTPRPTLVFLANPNHPTDRKSAGSGQSVAVRVHLGGPPTSYKKN